jgi:hypothetical protein
MTRSYYQQRVTQHIRYLPGNALHYLIPGLHREADEFMEAFEAWDVDPATRTPVLLELGDILWFIAAIYAHFTVRLDMIAAMVDAPTVDECDLPDVLVKETGKLLDLWVKVVRDHAGNPGAAGKGEMILTLAANVWHYTSVFIYWTGTSIEHVMLMNLEKLDARHKIKS